MTRDQPARAGEALPRPVEPISIERLLQDPQLRRPDLDLLRAWADKQPHLPHISDRELALFLQCCYYSVERAKVTTDTYFTARTHLPDFFRRRDPGSEDLKQAARLICMIKLPKKTPEHYTVIFCRMVDTDPTKFVMDDIIKVFFMLTDLLLLEEGPSEGHVIVVDLSGVTLGHIARLSLISFKKFFYYLQEALPFRLKSIHFINTVSFMDKIMAMIKPFMNRGIQDLLNLYPEAKINDLYKYVPKEILPQEYGGDSLSFIDLHERSVPRLRANRAYFAAEEQRVVEETRRPGRALNAGDLFGLEGSFKKLDID